MKKIGLVLLFIITITPFIGQDLLYKKIHGGILNEEGKAVLDNGSDGFMVLGSTGSNEDVQNNFYLLETDNELNFEWSKTYGSSQADQAASMVKSPDGGYVLFGTSNGYDAEDYDFIVFKIDADGEELWSNTYGGSDWELAHEIVAHPDGGYLLLGETYSYGAGMNDVFLVHIDEDGNELWWNSYGGEKTDSGRDLIIRENLTIAVTGKSTSYTLEEYGQCSLLLIDLEGELLEQRYYGFDDFEGNAIYEDNDRLRIMGSLVIDGDLRPYFMGLATNDQDVSFFNEHGFGGDQNIFDFFKYEDQYYCVGSSTEGGNGGGELYLLTTNDSGYYTDATTFGSDYFDIGNKIVKDPDEDYVVIVGTITGTYNDGTDVYLLKVPMGILSFNEDDTEIGGHFDPTVDIENLKIPNDISIFPNPSTEFFNIEIPNDYLGGNYSVFDITGKAIINFESIDRSNFSLALPNGYYQIRFSKGNLTTSKSVIIR